MSGRAVPPCAIDLIKRFEGLHDGDKRTPIILEPEPCPAGIYTVGWGYALFQDGQPVKDRETAYRMWRARWPHGMTRVDADALCVATAQDVCDRALRLLPGVALNDHELGAVISLVYNIGVGEVGGTEGFADSTVRRQLLAGDRHAAADAFRLWCKCNGRVLNGLVARREAERALFLTPVAAGQPLETSR